MRLFFTFEATAALPEKGLLCGSRRNPSNLGFQPERSRELLSLRFLRPGKMPGRRDKQDACVTLSALRLRQFHRRVIENED